MTKYKMSVEWTRVAEMEVEANSYEEALRKVDNMTMEELNRRGIDVEDTVEHNVQMNLILNQSNRGILTEVAKYHDTIL